jgi:hypothetical protein
LGTGVGGYGREGSYAKGDAESGHDLHTSNLGDLLIVLPGVIGSGRTVNLERKIEANRHHWRVLFGVAILCFGWETGLS